MADPARTASLYQQLLGRAPDASGSAHYAGMTEDEVRRGILGSAEYGRRAAHQAAFPTMAPDQAQALAQGGPEARQAFVEQQYGDILGRRSDPEGLAYWSDPTRFASAMSDGTLFNDFLGNGVMSDPNGSTPWDKSAKWAKFSDDAQAATGGINRMPGVFSDYGSVPADGAARDAMFFTSPAEAEKSWGSNPFLAAILKAAGGNVGAQGGATGAAAAQSRVPDGYMRADDPYFMSNPRIGNQVVIDGVTYYEPI